MCPGLVAIIDITVLGDGGFASIATYIAQGYQLWEYVCVAPHRQMS